MVVFCSASVPNNAQQSFGRRRILPQYNQYNCKHFIEGRHVWGVDSLSRAHRVAGKRDSSHPSFGIIRCTDFLALDQGRRISTSNSVQSQDGSSFPSKVLEYIERICSQCIPEEVVDEGNLEPGSRLFQPMLPPDHPVFETAMNMEVFDVVRSRLFHNEKHTPICFKYGTKRKCRFRFPRMLIPHTLFDEDTGVIVQKRDREWLNNYNRWFSLVMRTNHDCQYLFSQTEALAKIYYTMKYISKAEESTYSKLTIAALSPRPLLHRPV